MREILFKGKSINSETWRYGFYCHQTQDKKNTDYIFYSQDNELCAAEVIHETVSQYTGFTAENGKKIFEGDLCLCNRNIAKRIDKRVFEIKFDNDNGGFLGESGALRIYPEVFYMCEIIGNIYDNPELMRGVANG